MLTPAAEVDTISATTLATALQVAITADAKLKLVAEANQIIEITGIKVL